MMERSEILSTMKALKLFGMSAGYDEIVATAVKRQHEPQPVVGDLLTAEPSESEGRSAPPVRAPPRTRARSSTR